MACYGINFDGYMAWNYLDLGPLGADKELEGFDVVIKGVAELAIGYDEREGQEALATAGYTIDGDTLPGVGMLPFSLTAPSFQFRLTFQPDEPWEWFSLNVYKVGEYGT